MADIKVRVGQQNAIKVLSSTAAGNALRADYANEAKNVIGGISSVSQSYVSGITTFVGITTTLTDFYVGGNLHVSNDLTFDEFNARNANITGISTVNYLNITGIVTATTANITGTLTAGLIDGGSY